MDQKCRRLGVLQDEAHRLRRLGYSPAGSVFAFAKLRALYQHSWQEDWEPRLTPSGLAIAEFRVYDFDDTRVKFDTRLPSMERRFTAIPTVAAH